MAILSLLLRDQAGGAAVILSLAFVALGGALGLAIDSARVYNVHSAIKGAADAAALAAVAQDTEDMTRKERRRLAKMYFRTNCGDNCRDITKLKVRFRDNDQTVRVIAESSLPTSIGASSA